MELFFTRIGFGNLHLSSFERTADDYIVASVMREVRAAGADVFAAARPLFAQGADE